MILLVFDLLDFTRFSNITPRVETQTTYGTSHAKRSRSRKRFQWFIALKTRQKHENPGCIGILADIGDICDFRVSDIFIEPSDEHPMG